MAEKLTEISEGKEKAEGLVKDSKSKSSEMEESFLTKFSKHNYNIVSGKFSVTVKSKSQ